jgi:hypothetical protein
MKPVPSGKTVPKHKKAVVKPVFAAAFFHAAFPVSAEQDK